MNTRERLTAAIAQREAANREIAELQKRLNFEQSFGKPTKVYMVTKHDVSFGRLESVLAVFESETTALRFRSGQPHWREAGLEVEAVDFYLGRV